MYGFIPECMEDKWFMYFEDNVLYCHRSWTGQFVYKICFYVEKESVKISEIKFNSGVYKKDIQILPDFELNMALFLIERILLNRDIELPLNPCIKLKTGMDYCIYRHGVVGNSNSNDEKNTKNGA